MPFRIHPSRTPLTPDQLFAAYCAVCHQISSLELAKNFPRIDTRHSDEAQCLIDEELAFGHFMAKLCGDADNVELAERPLVPKREHDLEDIAFEILRAPYQRR